MADADHALGKESKGSKRTSPNFNVDFRLLFSVGILSFVLISACAIILKCLS